MTTGATFCTRLARRRATGSRLRFYTQSSRTVELKVCASRDGAIAPFVYVRLHGPDPHHLYAGSYPDADLTWWADRLREWDGAGKDVFVYFNNDGHGNAVRKAVALRHLSSC